MYAQGNGYSQILHYLHQKGYKTKRGQEFQKNSLYSILTNKKYQGIYVFNQSSSKSISGSRNTHLHKNSDDIICIEAVSYTHLDVYKRQAVTTAINVKNLNKA